jgi:pimeloyl-ACP methyl ester carboxylesterase
VQIIFGIRLARGEDAEFGDYILKHLDTIRSYSAIVKLVSRPRRPFLHHLAAAHNPLQKHCILLHGWGAKGRDMEEWAHALRDTAAGKSTHFWIPTYDTSWRNFAQSAREIKVLLEKQPFDFSRTLIVGYSMGGLVARELARAGFPFQQLVTLCSPHQGAAPWIPIWWRRTPTLKANSKLINNLNSSNGDAVHRSHYHFWGLTYRDPGGLHQHDGIVEISSALGQKLGNLPQRQTYLINLPKPIAGLNLSTPHVCALYPHRIPKAFENMKVMLENL